MYKRQGYDNCIYWILWLVQWEKINKKKKICFEIEERPIKNILKKYCRDLIWLVWSVIFEEANTGLVMVDGKLIEKPVLRQMQRTVEISNKLKPS